MASIEFEQPIHRAARRGKVEELRDLVKSGVSATTTDRSKARLAPIHVAIAFRRNDTLSWLAANTNCVNIECADGATPLLHAIAIEDACAVGILVDSNANVNYVHKSLDSITPLHAAAKIKNPEITYLLLSQGALTDVFCDVYRQTPVHWAARFGNLESLRALHKYKADIAVSTNNERGNFPIHFAAGGGHDDVVSWLLSNEIKVDVTNRAGYTPLHLAAYNGHVNVINILVKSGADLEAKTHDYGSTPLHLAVIQGHAHASKTLKQYGADLYTEDRFNKYTPLHYAVQQEQLGCLLALGFRNEPIIRNMKDMHLESLFITAAKRNVVDAIRLAPNIEEVFNIKGKNGWSLLHYASFYGSMDVTEFFLQKGFNINIQDHDLITPLHCAAYEGNVKILKLLLDKEADPNIVCKLKRNPLHYAVLTFQLQCIELLLKRMDVSAIESAYDIDGETPVHLASVEGYKMTMKRFIDHKININIPNKFGSTPLVTASVGGHYFLSRLLIENGADIHTTVSKLDNRTALHGAAFSGCFELVYLLVQKGANTNAVTSTNHRTPLHWAVLGGHLKVIKFLLESGADASIKDASGLTAAKLATMNDRETIKTYFGQLFVD